MFLVAMLLIASPLAGCRKPYPTAKVSDPASNGAGGGQPMSEEVYSLASLVKNSPHVFVAHLTAKKVETESRGLVVSRNRFEVENWLVGSSPEKSITLTTLGGTLGNETVRVSHMPEFVEGQTYIIFTDLTRTTYNPITANSGGVFLVVNSGIYTYEGRAIAGMDEGKFRFSSMVLDPRSGEHSPQLDATRIPNPTVGGGVTSAKATIVQAAPAMQLVDFSRYVKAAKQ
jgi:hypothetical protein